MTAATPSPPQYCPPPDTLDDLELLRTGVLHPVDAVSPGQIVELRLPAHVAADALAAGTVEIVDPEGVPLARVAAHGQLRADDTLDLDARPEFIGRPSPRTFERYYRSPVENASDAVGTVTVVVDRPLRPPWSACAAQDAARQSCRPSPRPWPCHRRHLWPGAGVDCHQPR